jgi:FkbM family methyltransferase
MVYGMGNGADKLFRRFEKYGISVAEVFASDGFVRGHSYRGYKVRSFSEIKREYPDFVIVLSFASNRREVIEMLCRIDSEYDMYIPDMPVADESEYFDRDFYNANYSRIERAFSALADDGSRRIFSNILYYKLTGKLSYLMDSYNSTDELYSLITKKEVRVVIDAGAYNGDTAREAEYYFTKLDKIYAIEPDSRNFKKLSAYAEASKTDIMPINAAVYSECRDGEFALSGNRNSTVSATASFEHKTVACPFITVDSLNVDADYIKYDVEGAEHEALVGSLNTIKRSRPVLLVSLYHRSRDVFSLFELLSEAVSGYSYYVRRLYSVPAWELDLIMIPNEIL